MQLEVVSALLSEKYKLETVVKEPSVIYMERPLKAASHTIHIEVPPNPFWASMELSVTPLSLGSGVQYEPGFAGILEPEFSKRCQDGIRYGLEQGLFGWNVTDCKICFEYGLYYSRSARQRTSLIGPDCIGTGIEGIGDAAAGTLSLLHPLCAPGIPFQGLS